MCLQPRKATRAQHCSQSVPSKGTGLPGQDWAVRAGRGPASVAVRGGQPQQAGSASHPPCPLLADSHLQAVRDEISSRLSALQLISFCKAMWSHKGSHTQQSFLLPHRSGPGWHVMCRELQSPGRSRSTSPTARDVRRRSSQEAQGRVQGDSAACVLCGLLLWTRLDLRCVNCHRT